MKSAQRNGGGRGWRVAARRLGLLCLLVLPAAGQAGLPALEDLGLVEVQRVFPAATELGAVPRELRAREARGPQGTLGWVFLTHEVKPIPAYSGKPVATLVALGADGRIAGAVVLAHEEPILVIGVSDADLQRFNGQYAGIEATEQVRVGAQSRAGYRGIDGLSGATITAMVINQGVMGAARAMAAQLGLPRPAAGVAAPAAPGTAASASTAVVLEPEWLQLWRDRTPRVAILAVALLLLVAMLFFQDWLVLRPVLFRRVRTGYLLFTVGFVGFWCMGQLSIVNMLAFGRAMAGGFSWETLLLEPVAFLLWSFVAVTIVLWGRGVYCGWLCPFGALQELVHSAALRFGVRPRDFPPMVHERLWALKYLLLIALFGLSLDSMGHAATVAEVEPFKTVFALRFGREWYFVAWALALLAVTVWNSKFYCKYLCPLGAALSFFTRFRVFDWLRRRRECGSPCQTCAAQCQIGAIRPTGEIIENECHYCLECQVTYHDEHRCPPLVERRKRREQREARAAQVIAARTDT